MCTYSGYKKSTFQISEFPMNQYQILVRLQSPDHFTIWFVKAMVHTLIPFLAEI